MIQQLRSFDPKRRIIKFSRVLSDYRSISKDGLKVQLLDFDPVIPSAAVHRLLAVIVLRLLFSVLVSSSWERIKFFCPFILFFPFFFAFSLNFFYSYSSSCMFWWSFTYKMIDSLQCTSFSIALRSFCYFKGWWKKTLKWKKLDTKTGLLCHHGNSHPHSILLHMLNHCLLLLTAFIFIFKSCRSTTKPCKATHFQQLVYTWKHWSVIFRSHTFSNTWFNKK